MVALDPSDRPYIVVSYVISAAANGSFAPIKYFFEAVVNDILFGLSRQQNQAKHMQTIKALIVTNATNRSISVGVKSLADDAKLPLELLPETGEREVEILKAGALDG